MFLALPSSTLEISREPGHVNMKEKAFMYRTHYKDSITPRTKILRVCVRVYVRGSRQTRAEFKNWY